MFQVFEPRENRNLEHLMFQCPVLPSIPRFNRLMFGPPGAVQASIRSTRKERSVRRHLKIGANHKVLARQTMTNGKWRPPSRNPSSEIGGYLKPFSFLNLHLKGPFFSGLPGRVRKVGVEGKDFRDLRADRLSLLAVLPAAGGGSCEALARWPAPRFNPGFLMLRPSPRFAGGRRPSPP